MTNVLAALDPLRLFGGTPGDGLPPGPPGGVLIHIHKWLTRPAEFMEECAARFGDAFTLHLPVNGDVVFVSHPDAVRDLFTGAVEDLHAGEANAILAPILGPGSILLLDGQRHLRERRLLMPPFHGERMQAYGNIIRDAARSEFAKAPTGAPHPIHGTMQAITLDVILHAIFGFDDEEERRALAEHIVVLTELGTDLRVLMPIFQIDLGRYNRFGRVLAAAKAIDGLVYARIARRKREGTKGRADILSLLVDARDEKGEPMSVTSLRDEMITLLLAGHETTATLLSWVIVHLLRHPDALARTVAEVDAAMESSGDAARLGPTPWVDAVIKESLRLTPVIPVVGRKLMRPLRIGTLDLPAGVTVAPSIFLTHRRPELYPDPTRFDPRRFFEAKSAPYEFFPFGGGVRRCVGMAFALYEARIVLATLLAANTIERGAGGAPRLVRRSVTFAPSDGGEVILRRRTGVVRAAPSS